MIYGLILLTLLGLGIGCKKEVEPVKPPVVVSPPTSTTTPPVSPTVTTPAPETIVSTTYIAPTSIETAYADVPQPPVNCRIARTTYKTVIYQGPAIDPEMVTVAGKSLKVSTTIKTTYFYDAQGRLVKDRQEQWLGKTDSTTYQHLPDRIITTRNLYQYSDKKYFTRADTLLLNAQGLAMGRPTAYTRGVFDAEGFLIRGDITKDNGVILRLITQTVKDKNIQVYEDFLAGEYATAILAFTYYPSRPNLPELTPFYGRESRNLPAKTLMSNKGSSIIRDGEQYYMTHIYTFDDKGRLKRRIDAYTRLSTSWPFSADGINVTDFEYDCP